MTPAMLHLSIPVADIESSLVFYRDLLGCEAARVEHDRIDFEFFGHHLVAQLSPDEARHRSVQIGNEPYPLRHFGVIVLPQEFKAIAARLQEGRTEFAMKPTTIFAGTSREQQVLIAYDPSGNALEIKALSEPRNVFSPQ